MRSDRLCEVGTRTFLRYPYILSYPHSSTLSPWSRVVIYCRAFIDGTLVRSLRFCFPFGSLLLCIWLCY